MRRSRQLPLRVGEHGLDASSAKLSSFKTVKIVEPILRDDGHRRAALMVNLGGRDVEGFVRDAEQRIKQQVKMPEGYLVEFGGQYQNLQEARARLAMVVPAALALIFVLIFLAFGSASAGAAGLFRNPARRHRRRVLRSGCAECPSASPRRLDSSRLSGVAVLNGLVMITYFNQLREEGHIDPRSGDRRFAHAVAPGVNDCAGCEPRLRADGHRHRHGRRSSAPARDRCDRRNSEFDFSHAGCAAGALCVV